MRHGPRGASEFAETVDRLVGFAETTDAIPEALIEAVHDAYRRRREGARLPAAREPGGGAGIAERFASARRRGLWHPLRNAVDDDLAALIAEARARGGSRHERAARAAPPRRLPSARRADADRRRLLVRLALPDGLDGAAARGAGEGAVR